MSKYIIDRVTKSTKFIISNGGDGTKFGWRDLSDLGGEKKNYHIGNDYNTPVGTNLYAPCGGEFLLTKRLGNSSDYGNQIYFYMKDYGNTLHLAHLNDIAHLEGKSIKEGTYIGATGNTGLSSGPHLHLGVARGRKTDNYKGGYGDGTWVNPSTYYLDKKPAPKPVPKPVPKPSAGIDYWRNEGGVFELTEAVNERTEPSTSGKLVKTHSKGTKLNYVAWGNSSKYTWFKLTNGNYVAFGERGVENYGKDYPEAKQTVQKPAIKPKKPAIEAKNKPSGVWKAEKGVFILNQGVYERDEPNTSDRRGLKLLSSGTRVPYDAYLVQGGYVWLRNSNTGKVIPWRVHNGERWGKIV